MGGGPQSRSLTSSAALGRSFCIICQLCTQSTRSTGRPYGNHVAGDVTDAAGPARRGLVKNVVHTEASVFLGKGVQVLLQQDILRGNVGEDEVNLGLVTGGAATNDSANDLEHGSDTSAASNHTKVTDHVRGVDEGALGTSDLERLSNLHRRHVLGDVTGGVGLDQEVEVAGLVVARNGSVGAHNLLGGAIRLGAVGTNGDVLTDGQAEDGLLAGEVEAVASDACQLGMSGFEAWEYDLHGDIVRDDGLLLELKVLEGIRLQDLLDLCMRGVVSGQFRGIPRGAELTHGVELVGCQRERQGNSVRRPFALGDEASEDDQTSGNVDVVKVFAGSQFGHFEDGVRGLFFSTESGIGRVAGSLLALSLRVSGNLDNCQKGK